MTREASDGYQIVGYDPRFKPAIARLQCHLWSPDEALNRAYFTWKHEANPYVPAPKVYLALFEGEPVGMLGSLGSCWEAGDLAAPQILLCPCDLVIAPEHRGRGLLSRMRKAARADLAESAIPYQLTLSSWVTRASSLRSGCRTPGPLLFLRRPRHTERREGWEPFRGLDRRFHESGSGEGLSVASTPRGTAMVDLVRRIGSDGRIRHVRDETYFTWRFGNPRSTYRFVYLDSDRLEAYLVLQTRSGHGVDRVRILDWEGETAAARRAVLLGAVEQIGDSIEIVRSALAVPDREALHGAGFIEQSSQTVTDAHSAILVYGSTDPSGTPWLLGGRDLLDPANWDLRALYSDGN